MNLAVLNSTFVPFCLESCCINPLCMTLFFLYPCALLLFSLKLAVQEDLEEERREEEELRRKNVKRKKKD